MTHDTDREAHSGSKRGRCTAVASKGGAERHPARHPARQARKGARNLRVQARLPQDVRMMFPRLRA
eukprot:362510-Chlamydomonas_euryale.AAC.2